MDDEDKNLLKVLAIIMGVFWILFIAGIYSLAKAHDAPSGWSYDYSCCNTYDCRPVEAHATGITVVEVSGGFEIIRPSGKKDMVPHGDKRLKESRDEHYHVCTSAGSEEGRLFCLYIPFRGY